MVILWRGKGPSPVSRLPACPRTIARVAPLGRERRLAQEAGLKLDASTVRPVDRLTTLAATGDVLRRFAPQVLDDWTSAPLARRRGSPLMVFHPRVVWVRFGRAARGAYFRDKRAEIPARHAINWCVWFKRPVAKLALHGVADKRCAPQSTFLSVTRKGSDGRRLCLLLQAKILPFSASQSRQAGAAITKGRRSERDFRHSVTTRGRVQGRAEVGLRSEDAMDLSTKLKITAVLMSLVMAVVWVVPVPV